MRIGGVFDSSRVRGLSIDGKADLDFHNTDMSGHAHRVEQDYELARSMGLTVFRDGAWLQKLFNRGEVDWTWLDKLADLSQGQIQLAICHYETHPYASEHSFWSGISSAIIIAVARKIAERYKGVFHSYVPVVELGYWTSKIAGPDSRWWPRGEKPWWQVYETTSQLAISVASAIKDSDPDARIAMSEPWGLQMDYDDQARPFNTLLGRFDKVAVANKCTTFRSGHEDLLDIVGINLYNLDTASEGIWAAKSMFPGKEIIVTETGNCHQGHIHPDDWLSWLKTSGAETVMWAPLVQMLGFEHGQLAGGHLVDKDRNILCTPKLCKE